MMNRLLLLFVFLFNYLHSATVELGVDRFFSDEFQTKVKGKRIGLITNQTGISSRLVSTIDLFLREGNGFEVVALFAPEHGLQGNSYAAEKVSDGVGPKGIPIYSLHGKSRRPTDAMLKGIDLLVYDIQDIGCRTYTYVTTLFYVMEEAAKRKIGVVVLDRPNPMGGMIVDGPMLDPAWRSFIGYINVPYCHGMTVGELARFFNQEYQIGCQLMVVPMKGWKREMHFKETGLNWVPTSPNIPESDTPLFYASTGVLGELGIVNIGVGYTLPFKVIGAPWINGQLLADRLNAQNIPGVQFAPFYYRPFYGPYKQEDCEGVLIHITDSKVYRPVQVQYLLIGMLKSLYPKEVGKRLASLDKGKRDLFCKANGNEQVYTLLSTEKYIVWKLIELNKEERTSFLETRKKYLLY